MTTVHPNPDIDLGSKSTLGSPTPELLRPCGGSGIWAHRQSSWGGSSRHHDGCRARRRDARGGVVLQRWHEVEPAGASTCLRGHGALLARSRRRPGTQRGGHDEALHEPAGCPTCLRAGRPHSPAHLGQPKAERTQPRARFDQPHAGMNQPGAGWAQPKAGMPQPEAEFSQPGAGWAQPKAGIPQPEAEFSQPGAGWAQPEAERGPTRAGCTQREAGLDQPRETALSTTGGVGGVAPTHLDLSYDRAYR